MFAVLDCDILSTFAKINKIELLEKKNLVLATLTRSRELRD